MRCVAQNCNSFSECALYYLCGSHLKDEFRRRLLPTLPKKRSRFRCSRPVVHCWPAVPCTLGRSLKLYDFMICSDSLICPTVRGPRESDFLFRRVVEPSARACCAQKRSSLFRRTAGAALAESLPPWMSQGGWRMRRRMRRRTRSLYTGYPVDSSLHHFMRGRGLKIAVWRHHNQT